MIIYACWAPTPLSAQRVETALRTLEREWADALAARDRATLERILAPDFRFTSPRGRVVPRTEYIDHRTAGDVWERLILTDVDVRVYGLSAAVVTARAQVQGRSGDRLLDSMQQRTDTWVMTTDRWQVVASHFSPINYPEAPAGGGSRAGSPVTDADANAERSVREVDRAVDAAALAGDTAAVRTLYAQDFVSITQDGAVRTRDDRIRGLASGEVRYESITEDDVRVRLVGPVAVVTGRAAVRARVGGSERIGTVRYTRVYGERDQRWRLLSQQLTRVSVAP
ncbi:MAG: hypothetical protein NVS1B4_15240 [Gemmatimonadaceae bacterium]